MHQELARAIFIRNTTIFFKDLETICWKCQDVTAAHH